MMMLLDYSFYSPSGIAFLMLLAAIFFFLLRLQNLSKVVKINSPGSCSQMTLIKLPIVTFGFCMVKKYQLE